MFRKIVFLVCMVILSIVFASAKSDCEKHRDRAEAHESIMKLIPQCKENGDYEELQQYNDSKFKVCYDKNGHAVSPLSTKLTQCNCHFERKRKIDSNHENVFVPQCNDDGSFSSLQCWDYNDSCWCVDENGKTTSKVTHDKSQLNC